MNPMGRVGKMEELQNLAVFLISGGCDWINGETIAMDGGQALAMGGNFYQLRDWSRRRLDQARGCHQGAERKGQGGAGVESRRRPVKSRCRPGERRDPYAAPLRSRVVLITLLQ